MNWIIVKLGEKVIKHHRIDTEHVTIGRARDNEIVIENLSVSRNHARIITKGDKVSFIDLNSSNGSYVNGVRVSETRLTPGDVISIGKHRLHFAEGASFEDASQGLRNMPRQPPPPDESKDEVAVAHGEGGRVTSDAVAVADVDQGGGGEFERQVREGELAAALIVKRGKQQGRVFAIGADDLSIGRHGCDVRLYDMAVGKKHAVIRLTPDAYLVRDLGSWHGTTLNGEKIREKALHDHDELILGSTILEFRVAAPAEIVALRKAADRAKLFPLSSSEQVRVSQLDLSPPGSPPSTAAAAAAAAPRPLSDDEIDIDSVRLAPDDDDRRVVDVPEEDDEFAPMTEEELAALEEEADDAFSHIDEEAIRRAEWEQREAERMMAEGGGLDAIRPGAMIEPEEVEPAAEEKGLEPPGTHDDTHGGLGEEDLIDAEEEEYALFRGPVADVDPSAPPTPTSDPGVIKPAGAPAAPAAEEFPVPEGVDPKEFRRWTRGLRNKSKVVRREAARKLKELTGIDYDWESDPK